MTNPDIKVKTRKKIKKDATEMQMLVASDSDECYEIFDRTYIINSLVKEISISNEIAIKIAEDVEKFLIKNDMKHVTTSFIRNILNDFLGNIHNTKYLKYNSLSIPIYDVAQLINNPNKENSNTLPSPEAVNLTIAGQILQQYALREVFNPICSDAHLKGEIHLHDLPMITRPYAFDGDLSFVNIANKLTGAISTVSIKELLTMQLKDYVIEDNRGWTDIISLIELNENKDIFEILLETGEKIYVTEDHPCLKYKDGSPIEIMAKDLLIGDEMYVAKHQG